MAYARRDIRGGAVETTLVGALAVAGPTFQLNSSTGWPDGSSGSFYVVIDRPVDGTANASMEKILCSSRTGTTVTVQTRGVDGTSAIAHSAGARVEHVMVAVDIDEANYAVSQTVGKITTSEDMLVATSPNVFHRLAKGTDDMVLATSGGVVGWRYIVPLNITASYRMGYASGSAPPSPSEGDLWSDTTNNALKIYNGATWTTIATY